MWIVIVVVHIDLIKLNEIRIKTDFSKNIDAPGSKKRAYMDLGLRTWNDIEIKNFT